MRYRFESYMVSFAHLAQVVEAAGLEPVRWGFESLSEYSPSGLVSSVERAFPSRENGGLAHFGRALVLQTKGAGFETRSLHRRLFEEVESVN